MSVCQFACLSPWLSIILTSIFTTGNFQTALSQKTAHLNTVDQKGTSKEMPDKKHRRAVRSGCTRKFIETKHLGRTL